ncbi:ABC-type lipoprotein export system ATPase subunit [Kitasatospora gansuensis]|uniref:ABC-type lipoprotein export system ATPase subunit n=1 Tax=Kitasatospora gansuensis TaxID=258050 RepID=A0A7W7SJT5_9ACTN|nr:ABC transporter ATP-binding protein [Kitasatospora gansuensis]MBB4951760.1 ABC-type lipoprotein export system ATPase subunit [Kitasatospora gansuensis]
MTTAPTAPSAPTAHLSARGLSKSYTLNGQRVPVLDDATLELTPGRITALVGHSGSGKTTLLQIAGLLLPPDRGSVRIDGQDAWSLSDRARTGLRRSALGFVFHSFNLLPQHTALRNAALPWAGAPADGRRRAVELLDRVGLADRTGHRPGELSAGEQQRVALARALINNPGTVLADEPTGNLDTASERRMLALLREVADEGRSVLLVTHSAAVAAVADEVLTMTDRAPRRTRSARRAQPARPPKSAGRSARKGTAR